MRRSEENHSPLKGVHLAIIIAVVFLLLNAVLTVNGMSPFAALD